MDQRARSVSAGPNNNFIWFASTDVNIWPKFAAHDPVYQGDRWRACKLERIARGHRKRWANVVENYRLDCAWEGDAHHGLLLRASVVQWQRAKN